MSLALTATVTCRIANRGTVTMPNVPLTVSKNNSHRYITEASQLQLRPGEWPSTITIALDDETSFWLVPGQIDRTEDNELISRTYVAPTGNGPTSLVIFND